MKIKRGLREIKKGKQSSASGENLSVTLVIPFRNEVANLRNLINDVAKLETENIELEVIFVNDHSEDDWEEFRTQILQKENWRILELGEGVTGKKNALTEGIKYSDSEIILVTDADCQIPKNWLKLMVGQFDEKTGFVAGAVRYKSYETLFTKIQALEFGGLILTGAGLIGAGEPVICSAASMAFRRKLFIEVEGYNLNNSLSSGDDEFLMRSIARLGYKVGYLLNKEGIVETDPGKSIGGFVQQRSRWASKGIFYEEPILILKLVLIFLFYLSLILSPVTIWFFGWSGFVLVLISLLFKGLTEYFVLLEGKGLLYESVDLAHFLFAEQLHIPYIVFAAISGAFGGFVWKGRKLSR
ncbi:MAG: glycosyltransferase [Ignavibacteriales bacterium]|nr:glycosyltransferase [Ignavibacteriales bacterium]